MKTNKIPVRRKSPNKTKFPLPHPPPKHPTKHEVSFVLDIYSWSWGLPWSMVDIPTQLCSTGENWFSPFQQYQLQIAYWLGVGLTIYLPFSCWDFVCLNLWRSCVHCHSLYEFIWLSVLLCLTNPVSLEPPTTSGSYSLSTSSSHRSWCTAVKGLMKTFHLGPKYSKVFRPLY